MLFSTNILLSKHSQSAIMEISEVMIMRKPEYKLGIKLYAASMAFVIILALMSGWVWAEILPVIVICTIGSVLLMIAERYKTRGWKQERCINVTRNMERRILSN